MNYYTYGGVLIKSNVSFDQMVRCEPVDAADIEIDVRKVGRRGWLEPELGVVRPYVSQLTSEFVVLEHPVHGQITVTPNRIIVEIENDLHWEQARTYILGTGLAICSYMNGRVPFHMSVVQLGESAIAFSGESHSGKSTWAALTLIQTGGSLLSDDVARIGKNSGSEQAIVWPMLNRLRFREDLLEVLERNGLNDVRVDPHGRLECYDFPVASGPCRLGAVFLPVPSDVDDVEVRRISLPAALERSFENLFRLEYGVALMGIQRMMRAAFEVASAAPFFELKYRPGMKNAESNSEEFARILEGLL